LVLCCSQGRRQKEEAIRSRVEIKFVDLLSKLAVRVESGQIKDADKIHRAIGRLQQRHSRVQRFYAVQLKADETAPSKQRLEWKRLDESYKSDDALLGCYVLRLDQDGGSPQEWWKLYTTLSKAEEGFRSLKSDLGLRPNYHQKEIRVEGHVFITVLAYHLMWSILQMLQASGDNRSWETIRRILQTHAYTTILLPTQEGKLYRVRRAGQPEECQKAVYKILKVDWRSLPQFTTVVDNSATTL
jgi:transposase